MNSSYHLERLREQLGLFKTDNQKDSEQLDILVDILKRIKQGSTANILSDSTRKRLEQQFRNVVSINKRLRRHFETTKLVIQLSQSELEYLLDRFKTLADFWIFLEEPLKTKIDKLIEQRDGIIGLNRLADLIALAQDNSDNSDNPNNSTNQNIEAIAQLVITIQKPAINYRHANTSSIYLVELKLERINGDARDLIERYSTFFISDEQFLINENPLIDDLIQKSRAYTETLLQVVELLEQIYQIQNIYRKFSVKQNLEVKVLLDVIKRLYTALLNLKTIDSETSDNLVGIARGLLSTLTQIRVERISDMLAVNIPKVKQLIDTIRQHALDMQKYGIVIGYILPVLYKSRAFQISELIRTNQITSLDELVLKLEYPNYYELSPIVMNQSVIAITDFGISNSEIPDLRITFGFLKVNLQLEQIKNNSMLAEIVYRLKKEIELLAEKYGLVIRFRQKRKDKIEWLAV